MPNINQMLINLVSFQYAMALVLKYDAKLICSGSHQVPKVIK